jgi:hypothetical protein
VPDQNQPSNELIFNTLLDQNKALGRIEASQKALGDKMEAHIVIDDAAHRKLDALQSSHDRMKGATTVWSLVISAAVSGIGYYFGARH